MAISVPISFSLLQAFQDHYKLNICGDKLESLYPVKNIAYNRINGEPIPIIGNMGKVIDLPAVCITNFTDAEIQALEVDLSQVTDYQKCIDDPNRKFYHPINTDLSLYEYQKILLNDYKDIIANSNRIVTDRFGNKRRLPVNAGMDLMCGKGKTFIVTTFIAETRYKTIVVLKIKNLMKQWYDSCKKFGIVTYCSIKGIKAFIKQAKLDMDPEDVELEDTDKFSADWITKDLIDQFEKMDPTKCDVILIPDKHLSSKTIVNFINSNYNLIVFDESHLYRLFRSSHVNRFLTYTRVPYILGLSGTPKVGNKPFIPHVLKLPPDMEKYLMEQDTFTKSIFHVSGKIPCEVNDTEENRNIVKILNEKITVPNDAACDGLLEHDKYRNEFIVNHIVHCFNESDDIRGCVITSRRNTMSLIYKILLDIFGPESVYILDAKCAIKSTAMILSSLARDKRKYILVSTKQNIGTGVDIPSINTLFVHHFETNDTYIRQMVGRIMRQQDAHPRVVYLYTFMSLMDHPKSIRIISKMKSEFKKAFPDWYEDAKSYKFHHVMDDLWVKMINDFSITENKPRSSYSSYKRYYQPLKLVERNTAYHTA